jgi:hypothetical protein
MSPKTDAERDAERKKAMEEIEHMLDGSRPKTLGEGLSSGVGNIVHGAVGAAGVAVILPTTGLAVGLKQGGLLGGVIGLSVGAVGGVLGAAAVALGGVASGITQIVRGVAAVPESITAPRQG